MHWLRAKWVLVVVGLAALPRLYDAAFQQGMFWPDEIFQSLEQGHRLAFGQGMIPWEFVDGARSWIFPGAIAFVLKVGSIFLGSGHALVILTRVTMVAIGLSGLWAAMQLAGKWATLVAAGSFGKKAARDGMLLAGVLGAALPPLLVFGAKCMSEMVSGAVIAWVALLSLSDERRRLWLAGALAGLSIYLRYQNGVVAIGFLVWLLVGKRWKQARWFAEAATVVGLAGGMLDWVTWGQPFHSFIRYVQFNLIEGRAANWGQAPPLYYMEALWSSIGPASILILAGMALAARRVPVLVGLVVVYVALHSMVPHKELRFLMPMVPLALALAAAGLAPYLARAGSWAAPILSLIVVGMFASRAANITFAEMGQERGLGAEFSFNNSPWRAGEGVNLLLFEAGSRADLCGLFIDDIHPAVEGGYGYLHRNVPILFYWQWATEAANYRIARVQSGIRPGYSRVFTSGGYVLDRRDGTCKPPPPGYNTRIR